MKILVIFKAFLALLSAIAVARAVFFSHLYGSRAESWSFAYPMTQNPMLFEKVARAGLYSILAVNLFMLSYLINRILEHFPPYLSIWLMLSSVVMQLAMTLASFAALAMYDQIFFNLLLKWYAKRHPNNDVNKTESNI